MSRRFTARIAAAALAIALSSAASAANTVWLRVFNVKTDDVAAYLQEVDKGRAMFKRMGIPAQIRVWRATFAGPNAGSLIVTQEYPSWSAFSEAQSKIAADPGFAAHLVAADKMRTVTSDSLYREL